MGAARVRVETPRARSNSGGAMPSGQCAILEIALLVTNPVTRVKRFLTTAFSTDSVYNLANGVTIVVAATKGETATTDASAFTILREVVKYVTPASPINF
jgi:hypothetical protein